jgi:hypothetical protein
MKASMRAVKSGATPTVSGAPPGSPAILGRAPRHEVSAPTTRLLIVLAIAGPQARAEGAAQDRSQLVAQRRSGIPHFGAEKLAKKAACGPYIMATQTLGDRDRNGDPEKLTGIDHRENGKGPECEQAGTVIRIVIRICPASLRQGRGVCPGHELQATEKSILISLRKPLAHAS